MSATIRSEGASTTFINKSLLGYCTIFNLSFWTLNDFRVSVEIIAHIKGGKIYLHHKSDILAVEHGLFIPPSPLYQTPHVLGVYLCTERWLSIAANMCATGLHFTPNCAVCVWKCNLAMHHCGSPTLTYYWLAFFSPLLLTCWVMSSQCNLTLSSAFSRSQPFTPLMYYRWPRGNWGNPAGRELIYSNPILGKLK